MRNSNALAPCRHASLRLKRRLNCKVSARLGSLLNRRPDGRGVRPKNPFKEACAHLGRYVRLRERAARRDPHLCGPYAQKYYQDTVRMEQEQRTLEAALRRVYGPDHDTAATITGGSRDSIWVERYVIPPGRERRFRKWFRETYGS
jgi:hypothetical protein